MCLVFIIFIYLDIYNIYCLGDFMISYVFCRHVALDKSVDVATCPKQHFETHEIRHKRASGVDLARSMQRSRSRSG